MYWNGEAQNMEVNEKDEEQIWKKGSIFFDFTCWRFNHLHHNVMHIEKNICYNILETSLNLKEKFDDNFKAKKIFK